MNKISRSDFSSRLLEYTRRQRVELRLAKRSENEIDQLFHLGIAEGIRKEEMKLREVYEKGGLIAGSRL